MSAIKTITGYVELGDANPLVRAYERGPASDAVIGTRDYVARDTERLLGKFWRKILFPFTSKA